jgi:hypothetical protein
MTRAKVLSLLVSAVAGAVLGAFASFWWLSNQLKDAAEITNLAYRARLQQEAFAQYRGGSPQVAVYALNMSLKESLEYLDSPDNRRGGWWDVALTHARLGQSYRKMGDASNSQIHFDKAIEAFGRSGWQLKDSAELAAALQLIDENRLVEATSRFGKMVKK